MAGKPLRDRETPAAKQFAGGNGADAGKKTGHWTTLAGDVRMAGKLGREQIAWNSLKSFCYPAPTGWH